MSVRNVKFRRGHAPGHVRDAFCAAIEAFHQWRDGEPEPVVEFEVDYAPVEISISRACALVWACTDQLPAVEADLAEEAGLRTGSRTYAAAARAMRAAIREASAPTDAL